MAGIAIAGWAKVLLPQNKKSNPETGLLFLKKILISL
jgi:hypothetical protein